MSIPFTPTRADSASDKPETPDSADERDKLLDPVGGDGSPEIVDGEAQNDAMSSYGLGSLEEGSSIEQIRDILFGRQMSVYEERFSQLERRMLDVTEALRHEIKDRLDALDGFFREEAASLGRRITQERDARSGAVDELIVSLRQHRDVLNKRVDGVEAVMNAGAESLRSQVLTESNRAQEAIESRTEDLRKNVDENINTLRDHKADRQLLAALLADMAARLSEGDVKG